MITIRSGYRDHRILVKQVYVDERIERYDIIGRDRTITLESNRPFFRNKGLKHRRPDWKIISDNVKYGGSIGPLIEAIMNHLEPKSGKT